MLMVLAGFLVNNILVVGAGYPKLANILDGEKGAGTMMAIYAIAMGLAVVISVKRSNQSLRGDADAINKFNLYLIRSLFWCVLLVGVVDAAIALLRVEKGLGMFGADMEKNLIKANFVGTYIHLPLIIMGFVIARFTRTLRIPLVIVAHRGGGTAHRDFSIPVLIRTSIYGRPRAILVCGTVPIRIGIYPAG